MGEVRRFYINFLHQALAEYQKFMALTSPKVGVGWCFCFLFVSEAWSHGFFLLRKEADMANLNTFDGHIDVGINEMFRLLRSPWHSIMLDNLNLH